MDKISKAIGAGLGGGILATGGLPLLPDGTPWYGYVILYVVAMLVPALTAYVAPRNAD